MSKEIFQINDDQRFVIQEYIKVFGLTNGDMSNHRLLESKCVDIISDDMVFLRWQPQKYPMGWRRMSKETDIPIDILRHFRSTPEYRESLRKRLKIVGIDLIDGLSMKKGKSPSVYISNKFGINPIDIISILKEIEPRKDLKIRRFEDPAITNQQFEKLVSKTIKYLQHEIRFKELDDTARPVVHWLVNRKYRYHPIIAAKATGMIFA